MSRSALAPVINAGVMMAKVIWKAQNSTNGMVRKLRNSPGAAPAVTSLSNAKSKFPMTPPLPASPKARLNTITTQTTASRPIAKMFCMSMPSTFFERTMPP